MNLVCPILGSDIKKGNHPSLVDFGSTSNIKHCLVRSSPLRHLRSSSTLAKMERSSRATRSCIKVRNLLLAESDLDDEVVSVTKVQESVVPVMVKFLELSENHMYANSCLSYPECSSFDSRRWALVSTETYSMVEVVLVPASVKFSGTVQNPCSSDPRWQVFWQFES